ncbi:anaerobic ribonucleoside-triphosphate reductase activating protein [Marinobacterium sp. CAU 1594]|nr:anaerobic ribonucleoside-triphosphate reductase activating protein [Marinobacterium arenosum]
MALSQRQPIASDGPALRVSGITPLTTIDFPDHLTCVLYSQGCPLRCGYCQNPNLIPFETDEEQLDWPAVEQFLQRRIGLLEAVVFSGGEPTLQPGLHAAMRAVVRLGFKVGLHTAGVSCSRLAELLGLLDWVGLDVKAPDDLYQRVTGRRHQARENHRCLELLLNSTTPFECRTTVHWQLLQPDDLLRLARQLAEWGVRQYAVQISHGHSCLDPALKQNPALPTALKAGLQTELSGLFERFEWRE